MTDSRLILPSRETFRLGMIELGAANNEAELLELAKLPHPPACPPGWTLPSLAVAIAAARTCKALNAKIEALDERLDQLAQLLALADEAAEETSKLNSELARRLKMMEAQGPNVTISDSPNSARVATTYEPDPEDLEADYQQRVRKAQALARAGVGWESVCAFAFVATSKTAPKALVLGERAPTPGELRIIEAWLNRQTKGAGAL